VAPVPVTVSNQAEGAPGVLTCPRFPHGDLTTQLAAAVAVGKWETPKAFSKQAEPASFPQLARRANSAGV
jgi:hypothetical protein